MYVYQYKADGAVLTYIQPNLFSEYILLYSENISRFCTQTSIRGINCVICVFDLDQIMKNKTF